MTHTSDYFRCYDLWFFRLPCSLLYVLWRSPGIIPEKHRNSLNSHRHCVLLPISSDLCDFCLETLDDWTSQRTAATRNSVFSVAVMREGYWLTKIYKPRNITDDRWLFVWLLNSLRQNVIIIVFHVTSFERWFCKWLWLFIYFQPYDSRLFPSPLLPYKWVSFGQFSVFCTFYLSNIVISKTRADFGRPC